MGGKEEEKGCKRRMETDGWMDGFLVWMYLKHGHYGPQEGVEVFTVATRRLVAGFATKFASEQVHAQNAVCAHWV
jgi:hypothetical protein